MLRFAMLIYLCAYSFAQDVPRELNLDEALRLATIHNPSLAAARSHVSAGRAAEVTANLRPNPVFTSMHEDFNVFTPEEFDPTTDFTENVSFLWERGGKRQARLASAQKSSDVLRHTAEDVERQTLFSVRQAFAAALVAAYAGRLANENLQDFDHTLSLQRERLRTGDISQNDFDRLRIQRSRFYSDLIAAETAETQAHSQLSVAIGVTIDPTTKLTGSLEFKAEVPPQAVLLQQAMLSRPDYVAARSAFEKARADVRLAEANGAADVSIGPEFKRNGTVNNLGIVVAFPLRVFDRNQGEKARTRYEVEAAEASLTAVRNQVVSEVEQAYANLVAGRERVRAFSQDAADAKLIQDRAQYSFSRGATSLLDYIDAIRTRRDIETGLLNAQGALQLAVHQLTLAVGKDATR